MGRELQHVAEIRVRSKTSSKDPLRKDGDTFPKFLRPVLARNSKNASYSFPCI